MLALVQSTHKLNPMNKDRLAIIQTALEDSWTAETSASPDRWSTKNAALGQCATTACVVQDYMGGEIVNSVATLPDGSTDSHYFNIIEGEEVDLTRVQFPEGTIYTPAQPKPGNLDSTRSYVLSYEPTRLRYEELKARVIEALAWLRA